MEQPVSAQPVDMIGLLRSFLSHRAHVREGLRVIAGHLERRANLHDLSKLTDDEFAGFSRINAAARVHKFGSQEYADNMHKERVTINAHFAKNRHHPERSVVVAARDDAPERAYERHMLDADMTFLDVIEMVVDWWGARKGYEDVRLWKESFELNMASKGKYLTEPQRWLAQSVAELLGKEE